MDPAEIYKPFFTELNQKAHIFRYIICFVSERQNDNPSYEDLTLFLSEQQLPDNMIFSTDYLVQNVHWMWEQVGTDLPFL